ncbi:MAG: hypothetical protein RL128_1011 [Pseudomonadota bacterium]
MTPWRSLGSFTGPFKGYAPKPGVDHIALPIAALVPKAGLEPARPFGLEILSLLCLPFHHSGRARTTKVNPPKLRAYPAAPTGEPKRRLTISALLRTPILRIMLARCTSTVRGEQDRASAISLLVKPLTR